MIRCIVIDDEPLAIELLEAFISKVSFLQHVASYTNPVEAFAKLEGVDLVFSDIQMPELTGLQLIQLLQGRVKIIFVTAYSGYAVHGFEHNAVDYLVKPFSFDRFLKAASKARALIEQPDKGPAHPKEPAASFIEMGYLFIKTSNKLVKVLLSDVEIVEGLKDYIAFVTPGEKILALQSMRYAEDVLPADRFIRVHKSYIVSLDKIDSIEKTRIYAGRHIIPIGDTYRQQFFKRVGWKNL